MQKNNKDSPIVSFDPCPANHHHLTNKEIETFRCSLLSLNMPFAFLECLVPCFDKINHDHCYSKLPTEAEEIPAVRTTNQPQQLEKENETIPFYNLNCEEVVKCALAKVSLNLSSANRDKTEQETRQQSNNREWFEARSKRITGSKCGRILSQKKRSISLLRECLYPKPLNPPSKPIAWGRHWSIPCKVKPQCLNFKMLFTPQTIYQFVARYIQFSKL